MNRKRIFLFTKKIQEVIKHSIPILVPILMYIFDLNTYFDKIPEVYITIVLLGIAGLVIYEVATKKEVPTPQNCIQIASQNDAARQDIALVFGVLICTGLLVYFFLEGIPKLNISLFLCILLLGIFQSRKIQKTAYFKSDNGILYFENGKEKRHFTSTEIKQIIIFKNQITIDYTNKNHVIAFLVVSERDLKELQLWFRKHISNAIVTKS